MAKTRKLITTVADHEVADGGHPELVAIETQIRPEAVKREERIRDIITKELPAARLKVIHLLQELDTKNAWDKDDYVEALRKIIEAEGQDGILLRIVSKVLPHGRKLAKARRKLGYHGEQILLEHEEDNNIILFHLTEEDLP